MRKAKLMSVFALLTLLIVSSVGSLLAQAEPPTYLKDLGFDKSVSAWEEAEFDTLVDLIMTENLTIEQSAKIYKELAEEQLMIVAELWGARVGVSLEEIQKTRTTHRSAQQDAESNIMPCSGSYLWGCYPCEYSYVLHPTHVSHPLEDATECDSADPDWVFRFDLDYSNDPDSLSWLTTSNRIWWAVGICYPSGYVLNSYNYSFNPTDVAYLVVGETCVTLGGGVDNFDNNLILGTRY